MCHHVSGHEQIRQYLLLLDAAGLLVHCWCWYWPCASSCCCCCGCRRRRRRRGGGGGGALCQHRVRQVYVQRTQR